MLIRKRASSGNTVSSVMDRIFEMVRAQSSVTPGAL